MRELKRLVASRKLQDVVSFHESATEEFKMEVLSAAQVYVQPSHEEGFCLAFVEAMTRVRRLVGTRTGIMPVIACGDPLIRIVRVGCPRELSGAITELLAVNDPDTIMRDRQQRVLAKFSMVGYAEQHEQVYRQLV
jgi:glycosyltransferase involved in cell wall biosynthesis